MTLNGYFMSNVLFVPAVFSVVVLEESPCPRGSIPGPIFKSLHMSLSLSSSSEVQVLENFRKLSRLSVSALCAGVAMT